MGGGRVEAVLGAGGSALFVLLFGAAGHALFLIASLAGAAWTPGTAWREGDKRRYRTTWEGCKTIPKGAVERGWTWDSAMPVRDRSAYFYV